MAESSVRFTSFPRTKPPPPFVSAVVNVFHAHEGSISTSTLQKGLKSDPVLTELAKDLKSLGFMIETGKHAGDKLRRPVFFGENGLEAHCYEIDAFHTGWKCGLEIEAGRALMGNAIYRDLFQALVMVDLDHLCLAVPNAYKFKSKGKDLVSKDYQKTINVAEALFGHDRIRMPYGLTVIGY